MSKVEINTQAPDFSLVDLDEKKVHLSDFKGSKNVVVVFNRGFT
jgi:peroxiredoxin